MSTRKIVFLVIIGLIGLILFYGIWTISQNRQKEKKEFIKSISVWVVGDTSEQYKNLFSGFAEYNNQYKDTTIEIRVFPDYEKYQRILLSTLSEGTGPDIFMIEGGGDDILASKAIPVPDAFLDLTDFDKRYEDIFLPLLLSEGEGENITRSLLGVPIGYETLGLFYHKSLLRTVPKTWAELQTLVIEGADREIFGSNLGLGPDYTPFATDIIAYFLGNAGYRSTQNLKNGNSKIGEYLSYGEIPSQNNSPEGYSEYEEEDIGEAFLGKTLKEARKEMDDNLLTTIDLFMRGRIAMVIGYPSLIREIEKAEKRAGKELYDSLILTERLPRDSVGKNRVNIARYRYLAISGKTTNPEASASLLEYLMSSVGINKAREAFPLLISPVRSGSEGQKNTPLSQLFARTRLDVFIPELQDEIFIFDYGLKTEYEKMFREYIDRNKNIDITKLIQGIQDTISCDIESITSGVLSEKCLK